MISAHEQRYQLGGVQNMKCTLNAIILLLIRRAPSSIHGTTALRFLHRTMRSLNGFTMFLEGKV